METVRHGLQDFGVLFKTAESWNGAFLIGSRVNRAVAKALQFLPADLCETQKYVELDSAPSTIAVVRELVR